MILLMFDCWRHLFWFSFFALFSLKSCTDPLNLNRFYFSIETHIVVIEYRGLMGAFINLQALPGVEVVFGIEIDH